MQLVAFTGLKGSGKDTAAQVFIDAGFVHVKFAEALKGMLRWMLEFQGASPALVTEMLEGGLKEAETSLLGGQSPRWAMQSLGTDWGRKLIETDLWVNITMRRAQRFERVVISDVRFQNEVNAIRAFPLNGRVYRIVRPATSVGGDAHASETEILSLSVNGEIFNTAPSAEDFRSDVRGTFARDLGLPRAA